MSGRLLLVPPQVPGHALALSLCLESPSLINGILQENIYALILTILLFAPQISTASCYRRLIYNLSSMAASMSSELKCATKRLRWSEAAEKGFQERMQAFITALVLNYLKPGLVKIKLTLDKTTPPPSRTNLPVDVFSSSVFILFCPTGRTSVRSHAEVCPYAPH